MRQTKLGLGQPGTRKPEGGFVLIRAGAILSAWAALRAKIIRLLDLRVWLACHELVARRTAAQRAVRARYGLDELQRLVGGVGGKRLEHSVRRLEACGLLHWTADEISFPDGRAADSEADMVSLKRLVPFPRRLLRFVAGGATRVMTATILGHLLRCAFYRRGLCTSDGACKASWIAKAFGVDERNVKKARARLIDLGWIVRVGSHQWRMNRWGGRFCIDLSWSPSVRQERKWPPQQAISTCESPPPESNQNPLREYVHQKPASCGPTGVSRGLAKPTQPSLRHIQAEDLQDTFRLRRLHDEACNSDLAKRGEAGLLDFVALAEHARVYATGNPCGLFAALLRGQRWHFITHADETRARAQLCPYALQSPNHESRPVAAAHDVWTVMARFGWEGSERAGTHRELNACLEPAVGGDAQPRQSPFDA